MVDLHDPENHRIAHRMLSGLPAVLMCQASRRGAVGDMLRSAWDDAGYCIDAPELLPAGGMYAMDVGYGLGEMPEQSTAEREAA